MVDRRANLDMTCPQCGHAFSMTVGNYDDNTEFNCPGCGVRFLREGKTLEKHVNDAIKRFRRNIRK